MTPFRKNIEATVVRVGQLETRKGQEFIGVTLRFGDQLTTMPCTPEQAQAFALRLYKTVTMKIEVLLDAPPTP